MLTTYVIGLILENSSMKIVVGILLVVGVGVLLYHNIKKICETDNELKQYEEKDEWYKWIRLQYLLGKLEKELAYRFRRLKISGGVCLISFISMYCFAFLCYFLEGFEARPGFSLFDIVLFIFDIGLISFGCGLYYSCGLIIRKCRISKYKNMLGDLEEKHLLKLG